MLSMSLQRIVGSSLPRRVIGLVTRLRFSSSLVATAGLGCVLAVAYGQRESDLANHAWLIVAVVAVLILLVLLAAESLALHRLEQAIHRAREGLLEATPVAPFGRTRVGDLIREYNQTIATLGTMFKVVEECQGLFLTERNKINTILQSLPGALLSVSDDLRVTMSNRLAEELFSVSSGQLIGLNLFELLQLNERDRELLRDAFLYKAPIRSQEIALDRGNGQRYFALNLGFYSDIENDMGGVLILQDITDYRRLQDSVALREKLVAMGELAAGVAHELNTPLGNILGYTQLLERGSAEVPKLGEYTRIIASETRRCSRIVQDLLNFAREDRCSGETCEINGMIHDLIETLMHCRLKRYGIEVVLDLAKEPLVAESSCGQLEIALNNLLANAIHALNGVAKPQINIGSRVEDGMVVISVADNGPGVPADLRNRIFDPFFTTKGVGQGSGLGLPISQAILAKRGGYIVYDSDYTHGARFYVRLPAVDLKRLQE